MDNLNTKQDDANDNDIPQLSAETFAALQEFYKEQEQREILVGNTKEALHKNDFQENWQLSQFWYSDTTVNDFVTIVKKTLHPGDKIALISCPTLYKPIRTELDKDYEVHLYEYDTRFSIHGADFIKYDYNYPLKVPGRCEHYYDLVIADPPFLSQECLTKIAETIRIISKGKIILCTGAIMSSLVHQLLSLQKVNFEPTHKSNLANEFYCYSNYDIDNLL